MIEYGLIGSNVENSFSKLIHESFRKIHYELVSLKTEKEVLEFLDSDFKGLNVTIPYKNLVFTYCDVVSDTAKVTECVNTIVRKDGKLYGYNTDIFGFEKLIERNNITIENKDCLILGTGSTSRTVTFVLEKLGAKSIKYLSRDPKIPNSFGYNDFNHYKNSQIIINTTPIGMKEEESLLDFSIFSNAEYFVDVIYNKAHTKMAINALKNGIKTINGFYMLLAQAQRSQDLFFEREIEEEIVKKTYTKLFFKFYNLALIGHPLSGKTSVANALSISLKIPYIDIDNEIEKQERSKIAEIFAEKGEPYFRSLESSLIEKYSNLKGIIISLGGGSVLFENNMNNILNSSLVISLSRDPSIIQEKEFVNRPLCTCKGQLVDLISKRKRLYEKYSDLHIKNDGSIEKAIERIGEILWSFS